MARYTPNLGLAKPDGTDKVAISQLNSNMDILDEHVGQAEDDIEDILEGMVPESKVQEIVDELMIPLTEAEIEELIGEE